MSSLSSRKQLGVRYLRPKIESLTYSMGACNRSRFIVFPSYTTCIGCAEFVYVQEAALILGHSRLHIPNQLATEHWKMHEHEHFGVHSIS